MTTLIACIACVILGIVFRMFTASIERQIERETAKAQRKAFLLAAAAAAAGYMIGSKRRHREESEP